MLNLLIIIFGVNEEYINSSIVDEEFYKYLITPFRDTKFTLDDIENGYLLTRVHIIGYLVSVDNNDHLLKLISFNLLEFLAEILEISPEEHFQGKFNT